jgi:DNA polymerase-3 subunit epsilon
MFAIVDIETTGGNPDVNKIMDIALLIHDGKKLVNQFSTLINPERPIPPLITELTGITNEMVQDAPKFCEVAEHIMELTKDTVFVAHNSRFDYSFLKEEFRNLGLHFYRRQLCTVRLSRKLMPGIPSYSLGNLCEHVNITIQQRHRALGDAAATVKLFELLLARDKEKIIEQSIKDELYKITLPPQLPREKVENLPEEIGVYYFHDAKGDVIYLSQTKNIRRTILNDFSKDSNDFSALKNNIHDISYDLTGSELIALLIEFEEIKKLKNGRHELQKKLSRHGIFRHEKDGYTELKIEKTNETKSDPLITFPNDKAAKSLMHYLAKEFVLCQKLCDIFEDGKPSEKEHKKCLGACTGKEPAEMYNLRAEEAIQTFHYPHPNLLIIGKGRSFDEKSVVYIENGAYAGFGYLESSSVEENIFQIKEKIQPYSDSSDIRRIIRSYLNRHKKDRLIHF